MTSVVNDQELDPFISVDRSETWYSLAVSQKVRSRITMRVNYNLKELKIRI